MANAVNPPLPADSKEAAAMSKKSILAASILTTETLDHFDDDPDFGIGTQVDSAASNYAWATIASSWCAGRSDALVAELVQNYSATAAAAP